MYEGTEKIKKHDIRHFVIETTKKFMNCNDMIDIYYLIAFEVVTYSHISSHIATISQNIFVSIDQDTLKF